ncbi:MauE/DoxX family redox-associated membrane protein [Streptomyces sp. 4N509B]|uniref:MauE/DoxX family redox-associated membrane protein n=1 Tax=Streptomyces sp. 4N509B TaxID=3457413 RepID=UPI003FD15E8F
MATFCASAATGVVLLTLLAGCASHLTRPAALPDALRRHGVLPRRALTAVAAAVTAAEGLAALAGTAALVTGGRPALALVLAGAAVLFTAYAGYARHVVATGRGGPCGCSRAEVPMSDLVAGRALALALLALAGSALVAGGAAPAAGPAERATVLLAALTFSALLWVLPLAMNDPAEGGTSPWTSSPAR